MGGPHDDPDPIDPEVLRQLRHLTSRRNRWSTEARWWVTIQIERAKQVFWNTVLRLHYLLFCRNK